MAAIGGAISPKRPEAAVARYRTQSAFAAWLRSMSPGLSPREVEMLQLLWLCRGAYVSRDQLMDWLYGADEDPPLDGVIRVMVHHIRRKQPNLKLKKYANRGYVLTVDNPSNVA